MQTLCHPTLPRSGCGTSFSAALCSEAVTFFFSPFLANFSANSSQPHGCSQADELLLQNCTAPREVHFIYTPVPCPAGSQGHGDLSPQTLKHPFQSSSPLHSPCWPSWFEKSAGGGLCSSSSPCHTLSTAFPRKRPRSINTAPSQPLLKPSAGML